MLFRKARRRKKCRAIRTSVDVLNNLATRGSGRKVAIFLVALHAPKNLYIAHNFV